MQQEVVVVVKVLEYNIYKHIKKDRLFKRSFLMLLITSYIL